jgi:pimeloyl-ACP methyl ester carboxylesterase
MTNKLNIFLLHGWGGTANSLRPLANELTTLGYNTKVLELPGHGNTPSMSKPWSMNDFALWLKKQVGENKEPLVLIGHSFGGKTILEALINNLLNPKKIVLINISGIKPKNSFKIFFWGTLSKLFKLIDKKPFSKILHPLKTIVYKKVIRETDYFKASGNLKESFKLINKEFYEEELRNIKTDALLIWAKHDASTPLWMGKKLNELLKNSKIVELEGTHGLPLYHPAIVAKEIDKFLKQ